MKKTIEDEIFLIWVNSILMSYAIHDPGKLPKTPVECCRLFGIELIEGKLVPI